ncbi:hypothetical protein NLJ89_g10845 [Agrocybe chaxingu]|uniref:Uncharacterized protein n=1 Tax=Agrocybe chaxingu TaxID=84603 RepID=A0A9W8JXE4_9AGAR|nr:hypothetical protein NLJ89_g10845 [Agrocybe chaxingu]
MQIRLLVVLASGNTSMTMDVDSRESVGFVKSAARSALLKQFQLSEEQIQKLEAIRVYGSKCGGPGLSDDTTVSEVCPTQDDPLLAVVPTRNVDAALEAWAPAAILFPLQNLPVPTEEKVAEPSSDDLLSNVLARLAASERRENEREKAEKEKEKAEKEKEKKRADLAEKRRQQDKKELEDKFKKEMLKQERGASEQLRLAEKQWNEDREELKKKLNAAQDTISGLQTEIALIQGDVGDLFFLSLKDEESLGYIKRRNLLDRVQAQLADKFGVTVDRTTPSVSFRQSLGPSTDLEERRQSLKRLLDRHRSSLNAGESALSNDQAALSILADSRSRLRELGDRVAHGVFQRGWYEPATRSDEGLKGLLECIVDS